MTCIDKIIASLLEKAQAERNRFRANAKRKLVSGAPAEKEDANRLIDALAALGEAEANTLFDRLSGMTAAMRVDRPCDFSAISERFHSNVTVKSLACG